jgi:hypothetical protein
MVPKENRRGIFETIIEDLALVLAKIGLLKPDLDYHVVRSSMVLFSEGCT